MIQTGHWLSTAKQACRLTGFITCMILFSLGSVWGSEKTAHSDTLIIKKGSPIYLSGKIYFAKKDIKIVVNTRNIGDAEQSKIFYDSVYRKLSRKKLTKYIYSLAFRNPANDQILDTVQIKKSESPFIKYKGRIIRNIRVVNLDPFGPNIYDTNFQTQSSVGKLLNSIHRSTHNYVIVKNLQIKKGKKVNPDEFADNERLIRNLPYIHDVRTIIKRVGKTDSVDVTIITQDLWSVGFDLITITPSRLNMRLYDVNILGTGDKLSVNFTTDFFRAPFFLLNGISYKVSNLQGTFIDLLSSFSQDEIGNRSIIATAQRGFYSNKATWAGGLSFEYRKLVTKDTIPITAYLNNQNLWAGKAWFLEKENRPTRIVVLGAFNRTGYTSRPVVTPDSNRRFYNTTQFFPGIAYSRNNYYISDYLVEFGKIENIPYGNLFQINFGPEWTDFYTRFYTGFELSGGNFIKKVGYLSLTFRLGGYLYRNDVEDGIFKITTRFITPAITNKSQSYKFRSFFVTDFRTSFKRRSNNIDFFNINKNFDIENYNVDTVFNGSKSLSFTLSSLLFTPWYFYGFKFALIAQVQGGWWSNMPGTKIFNQPFYLGTGIGIMTKNDNLIFPAIIISLFYYPGFIPGIPSWQIKFLPDAAIIIPDYNPKVPGTETIQN